MMVDYNWNLIAQYIITYNAESGFDTIPYHIHIGLLDLDKIIKHKYKQNEITMQ
jgi:hypothetical protein